MMKFRHTKRRALADYIRDYGCFPCGCDIDPSGENVQYSRERDRNRETYHWRLRCRPCNQLVAREGMEAIRRTRRRSAR